MSGNSDSSGRGRSRQRLVRLLVAGDAVSVAVSFLVASLLRTAVTDAHFDYLVYALVAVMILLAQMLFFRLVGLYDEDEILAGAHEYGRVLFAATYNLFLVVGVSYFAGGAPIVSRMWLLLVWALTVVTVVGARFLALHFVRRTRRQGRLRTSVLIVGGSASAVSVTRQLAAEDEAGVDVAGFLDEYAPLGSELVPGIRVIGRPADLARNPAAFDVDEYVLVGDALPYERLDQLTRILVPRKDCAVRLTVGPLDLLARQSLLAQRSQVALLSLRRGEIVGFDAVLKRSFDIAFSVLAIVVLAPLAVVALAIALVRRRRPLFQIEHIIGRNGNDITLALLHPAVTKVMPLRGLPAFLRVLTGDLSIVGPRPQRAAEKQTPLALQLTAIRPGLTGPWRLSGGQALLEAQAKDDLTYIRTYTMWEDLRIMWGSFRRSRAQRADRAVARWNRGEADPNAPGARKGGEVQPPHPDVTMVNW